MDEPPDPDSLRLELERLRRENERLRQSARDVADANARAAELITDYDEERQRMQLRIEQTQKLESLGLLAGGIAHDFNNLLQAMGSFAELALQAMPTVEGSPRWEIEQVLETQRHAAELCEQLLSYAGKGHHKTATVDVGELIRGMRHVLDLASKGGRLDLRLPTEPICVQGDSSQLKQVVLNLVTNAGEAQQGKGGSLVVRADRTYCDALTLSRTVLAERLLPGEYVSLEVSDQGCGIAPSSLKRIFDPFYSSKRAGRGLGLSVVLGMVRSHGGAMLVQSEQGQGTSFRILLPPAARN